MFSLIFCLLPLVFAFYHFSLIKKRKSLSWEIKKGEICYHCKDSLNIDNDVIVSRILDNNDFSRLCVSCNRNIKIKQINRPYLKSKYQFLKFLVSGDFSAVNVVYILSIVSLIVTDIFLLYFNTGFRLWPIYGTMNLIFNFINIYRTLYTTTKKTSD
jgi:hypothetical protein